MGEITAYYIPEDQDTLSGRGEALADLFWEQGIFLASRDDHIHAKILAARKLGQPLPECVHRFSFGHMGLVDEPADIPVPPNVYDAACPACGAEVYEAFMEAMVDGDDDVNFPDRPVLCTECGHGFPAGETVAHDPGFEFARVYLYVAEISDDDWEPEFRDTVESVLGPCREILAWDT